jgi:uncharacterized membrane protein
VLLLALFTAEGDDEQQHTHSVAICRASSRPMQSSIAVSVVVVVVVVCIALSALWHSLTPCLLPRCFCCEELQCLLALCLCYEMLTHSILLLYRLKHQAPLLLLHAASARQLTHSFRCLLRVGALVFLGLGLMLGVGLGSGRCGIKSLPLLCSFRAATWLLAITSWSCGQVDAA